VVPPGQETEEVNDDFTDDTAGLEDQPTDQTTQADEQQQQQPNGQPLVKTPEQLLQELQRQQQQQQQNPQSGQPPQGVLPNQPPTAAPANPNKPD
jgi:hypothetical protein